MHPFCPNDANGIIANKAAIAPCLWAGLFHRPFNPSRPSLIGAMHADLHRFKESHGWQMAFLGRLRRPLRPFQLANGQIKNPLDHSKGFIFLVNVVGADGVEPPTYAL